MATYATGADYIKTSIHGRRLGLDNYDTLRGQTGSGEQIEYLTSADAGATLYPGGATALNAGASSTGWQLTPPSAAMVGMRKTVTTLQAVTNKLSLASGAFGTSTGAAAATVATSTGIGQTLSLLYVSSSVVQVTGGTFTFA